jgi:hypothetical protein
MGLFEIATACLLLREISDRACCRVYVHRVCSASDLGTRPGSFVEHGARGRTDLTLFLSPKNRSLHGEGSAFRLTRIETFCCLRMSGCKNGRVHA